MTTKDNISFECGLDRHLVVKARTAFFQEIGVSQFCEVKQVHGNKVLYEPPLYQGSEYPPDMQEADGIAIDKENIALLIKTADCQPLLFADSTGRYLMALHVGWRGNAQHYIYKAVDEFCAQYALAPEQISVVRGPSLSPYNAEFIHAENEFKPEDMVCYNRINKTMDLWKMTKEHLQESGIPESNIYSIDICTFSSPFLFSYRQNHNTGRQASIIMRKTLSRK